jgi:hypothetical protein
MTAPLPADSPDWEKPYTGWDYLQDSLRQQREMEAAQRQWLADFLSDVRRVEEWRIR